MERSTGDIDRGISNEVRDRGIILDNITDFETTGDELGEVPFEDAVRSYAEKFDLTKVADTAIGLLKEENDELEMEDRFLRNTDERDEIKKLARRWPKARHETQLDILQLDKFRLFFLKYPGMADMENDIDLLIGKILDQAVRNCKMSRGY